MLTEQHAAYVGTGIVHPDGDEYCHEQNGLISADKENEIEQRKWQGNVHLTENEICPVVHGIFFLPIQFGNQHQKYV